MVVIRSMKERVWRELEIQQIRHLLEKTIVFRDVGKTVFWGGMKYHGVKYRKKHHMNITMGHKLKTELDFLLERKGG